MLQIESDFKRLTAHSIAAAAAAKIEIIKRKKNVNFNI